MKFEGRYDSFISLSAWLNVIIYIIPGFIVLGICELAEVPVRFWIPLFFIYLLGGLAHILCMGFQSICIQMVVIEDNKSNDDLI